MTFNEEYKTEKYQIPFTIKENGKTYSVYKDDTPLKLNIPKHDLFFTYEDKEYQIAAPNCDLQNKDGSVSPDMLRAFLTACSWKIEDMIDDIKFKHMADKYAPH